MLSDTWCDFWAVLCRARGWNLIILVGLFQIFYDSMIKISKIFLVGLKGYLFHKESSFVLLNFDFFSLTLKRHDMRVVEEKV